MNLFIVHCGFYDEDVFDGIYEFHVNIPIAAATIEEAKKQVHQDASFKLKKMHIDGIHEIKTASGYQVSLLGGTDA